MTTAVDRAMTAAQRSYALAKAATAADAADSLYAAPAGGLPWGRMKPANDKEKLLAFRGWVWTALRPICTAVAGQPIRMGTSRGWNAKQLDNVRPIAFHETLSLLADPSDLFTSWSLKFNWAASLGLVGRSFTWITEVDGKRQMLPIPAHWVVGWDGDTSYTTWIVRPPGSAEDYPIPSDEMLYMSLPDPADPKGAVSPLQACALAVLSDEAMQLTQRQIFSSPMPKMAIVVGKSPGPDGSMSLGRRPLLTGAQRAQIIRSIRHAWNQTVNAGEPAIIDGLIEDIKKLQLTPQEFDFLASGESVKKRIMQAFGVSPAIVGEELTNRASSLAAEIHFARWTVNPLLVQMSECLQEWLLPITAPNEPNLRIWIEPLAPKDEDLNLRWAQALAQVGALTPDEMRALSPLGLGDMPNGYGRLPAKPPDTLDAALEREMSAVSMTVGRMVAQDVVERRAAGKSINGHACH